MRSQYHTQLAKRSFDKIFDLTAGVYFIFYNIKGTKKANGPTTFRMISVVSQAYMISIHGKLLVCVRVLYAAFIIIVMRAPLLCSVRGLSCSTPVSMRVITITRGGTVQHKRP